jgi:hypothetical protein
VADAAPEPDASVVDVPIRSIGREPTGRTAALHAVEPTASYALIVHAPSKDDPRFGRHVLMLDTLFHPHDPAPEIVHVFSSPSHPLEYPLGRYRYQVEPEGAHVLQARFGEFAVILLDAAGHVLGSFTEPVDEREIHRLIHYRHRAQSAPPPPP